MTWEARLGVPGMGGPIITAPGPIFIAASMDGDIRAFDEHSGKQLWRYGLPAGGQATPMTYASGGRQYLVIVAGGHGGLNTSRGDYVIAFALPRRPAGAAGCWIQWRMPNARRSTPSIEVHARPGLPLGMPPARFLTRYWQKHPLLIRGAFPDFAPTLTPDELAGLACTEGSLARIVVHTPGPRRRPRSGTHRNEGRWQLRTGPFDDATFAALPERDWTLLVQDADKWDADTAALAAPFAFIPRWRIDDVMISYAVDGGGVGAHVDQYDVFLIQGLGQRRWAIDTRPDAPTGFRPDVELKLLRRFTPDHVWVLDPGDVLYLPPGVPHDGVAVGECMTFSVGFRAPAAGELVTDLAAYIAESLADTVRYADPDLIAAAHAGEIDPVAVQRVRRLLGAFAHGLSEDELADWFGRFITRYRVAREPEPRARRADPAAIADRLPRLRLAFDPWSRRAWRRRGRAARLYAGGMAFDVPPAWARALGGGARVLDGARLARLPRVRQGVAVLAQLIDAGHLHSRRR